MKLLAVINMTRKDTVTELRIMAMHRNGEVMQLPCEFVDIINGEDTEIEWSYIGIGKVIAYIADMME